MKASIALLLALFLVPAPGRAAMVSSAQVGQKLGVALPLFRANHQPTAGEVDQLLRFAYGQKLVTTPAGPRCRPLDREEVLGSDWIKWLACSVCQYSGDGECSSLGPDQFLYGREFCPLPEGGQPEPSSQKKTAFVVASGDNCTCWETVEDGAIAITFPVSFNETNWRAEASRLLQSRGVVPASHDWRQLASLWKAGQAGQHNLGYKKRVDLLTVLGDELGHKKVAVGLSNQGAVTGVMPH